MKLELFEPFEPFELFEPFEPIPPFHCPSPESPLGEI